MRDDVGQCEKLLAALPFFFHAGLAGWTASRGKREGELGAGDEDEMRCWRVDTSLLLYLAAHRYRHDYHERERARVSE